MNSDQYSEPTATSPETQNFSSENAALEESRKTTQSSDDASGKGESEVWRSEVAERLSRYRARRKARPPRYPSLRLKFDAPVLPAASERSAGGQPSFGPASDNALALDGFPASVTEPQVSEPPAVAVNTLAAQNSGSGAPAQTNNRSARIIQFPSYTPRVPSPDELAEPVIDRPRILEVPEFEPPPPALGGITIEPAEVKQLERRPGIDFPLQSAAMGRRVLAAAFDGIVVALASAVFGYVFWKVTGVQPPRIQLVGLAAGVPFLLWGAYQYLMLTYRGSTPGLKVAGLELARFDGSAARRRLRRVRVLASYLSAISLGMGYLWLFLDEDALCWHDRITHTFLKPRPRQGNRGAAPED